MRLAKWVFCLPLFVSTVILGQTRPATFPATLPAAPPLVQFPDGVDEVTIPITRAGGHLLVRPTINGQDAGWFFLDSGVTDTILDRSLADRLRLRSLGKRSVAGIGTEAISDILRIPAISLGTLVVREHLGGAMSFRSFNAALGYTMTGIIGAPVLRELPFTVDFRASTVTFHRRAKFKPPAGAVEAPLFIGSDQLPTISVKIEEHAGDFMIDLGSNGRISMHGGFVGLHPEMLEGKHICSSIRFGIGQGNSCHAEFNSVEMLGRKRGPVPISYPEPGKESAFEQHLAGLIGTAMFHGSRLTLDYESQRLWVLRLPPEDLPVAIQRFEAMAKSDPGRTSALLHAIYHGRMDAAMELIDRGADVNAADSGDATPLMMAAHYGDLPLVAKLLAKGAKPNAQAVVRAMTPLMFAAENGSIEIVQALLKGGATVDLADTLGQTPLFLAAAANWPRIVALLMEHKADPGKTSRNGETPLMMAAKGGHDEVAEMLLRLAPGSISARAQAARRCAMPRPAPRSSARCWRTAPTPATSPATATRPSLARRGGTAATPFAGCSMRGPIRGHATAGAPPLTWRQRPAPPRQSTRCSSRHPRRRNRPLCPPNCRRCAAFGFRAALQASVCL